MGRIRYDLTHSKGRKNLQILEDAVAMMKGEKQLPKSVRNSDARKYLDKNKDNFIDTNSDYNWQNYASIHKKQCAHFTEHFLPWHRVYINYFEKAVRTITGESNSHYHIGITMIQANDIYRKPSPKKIHLYTSNLDTNT